MNEVLESFAESYRSQLKEYLSTKGEETLQHARACADKAVTEGLGIRDIAAIHRESLAAVLPEAITPEQYARASEFLTASLSPFDKELSKLRESNAQMRREASERPGLPEEFLAALSHELKNPLMPILGWSRILRKQSSLMQDKVLGEGIESLERNAQNMARLVDDCLELARISENKLKIEQELLDLNRIARAAAEAVSDQASKRGIILKVELSPANLWISGDKGRLAQVMTSLLSIPIKYTEMGGVITLSSERLKGEAEIRIEDQGIGIASDFLDQIFEPFGWRTSAWLAAETGVGFGLALARHIAQLHGGRIWAESDGINRGSKFRLRLPLAPPSPVGPRTDEGVQQMASTAQGSRVLLIEDSEDILLLMKTELEWLGYTVFAAHDGKSGMEMALREKPDILISDIKMPGIDGYDVIKAIRLNPDLATIPAIALTGFGMEKDVERALRAGYDAHVSKPADPNVLNELIQKLTAER